MHNSTKQLVKETLFLWWLLLLLLLLLILLLGRVPPWVPSRWCPTTRRVPPTPILLRRGVPPWLLLVLGLGVPPRGLLAIPWLCRGVAAGGLAVWAAAWVGAGLAVASYLLLWGWWSPLILLIIPEVGGWGWGGTSRYPSKSWGREGGEKLKSVAEGVEMAPGDY
jgi:hypothetical protein